MLFENIWLLLNEKVFPTPSTDTLFNLYRDEDPEHDRPGAAHMRQENLRHYLSSYQTRPAVFLLAEAPGPWGCRFSGIPLVSEAQLVAEDFPLWGRATSLAAKPHHEYSARIYWRVLQDFFPYFFTWNTVPYHPHYRGRPMSIRTPVAKEISMFCDVLATMITMIQPQRVLAIGRKAERALQIIDVEATYVRHPSQGGARLFEQGVLQALETLQ